MREALLDPEKRVTSPSSHINTRRTPLHPFPDWNSFQIKSRISDAAISRIITILRGKRRLEAIASGYWTLLAKQSSGYVSH
jgi:hypothetical protein